VSRSALVTYVSRNAIDDSLHPVTASIYVPKVAPPPGGYPIVALSRPVAGTGEGCIPLSAVVADPSSTIASLLQAGDVVTVPDYLGLRDGLQDDQPASHPFLDSATAAENTIDAVRAARKSVPQTSALWVAMGTAEGGQAAWAANELAANYGYGLNLRGAASFSPTSDVDGLADAAVAGTLTPEQQRAYITYLDALGKEYPDAFQLDDYRRGVVAQNWDLLLSCGSDQSAQRAAVTAQITPDDLRPANADAVARLQGYLRKTTLPQGPTLAPMFVAYGAKDPLIPANWTQRALDRACAMDDTIAIQEQADDSPDAIDPAAALRWIADRFAGTPAPDDCPAVRAAHPVPVSAPTAVAPPPPPAPAAPVAAENQSGPSLIRGWLPIALQVVAAALLVAAIGSRSRRWRLRWLPVACGVGVVVAALAYWYNDYQGWGSDPPWGMWAWIAVTGFAAAVAVAGWPSAAWWRRAVSLVAVPLAALSAADVLNASLGYLPTVRAVWEMAAGTQPPGWIDQSALAAMQRNGVRPSHGTIVSLAIPADRSGFAHRDELVYLPPAWFESTPPPRLPAVMMLGAELSHPGDWLDAGGLGILDDFAANHRGTTPVFVFPDPSGAFANDTECVNGSRGNAADHLTKDVIPYLISHFGVSPDPENWGAVGWSTGGTCALTLAVTHPDLLRSFVDLDGQLGPNAGDKAQTVTRLFGGDANAWAAFDPKTVVEARGHYDGTSAWLGVSDQTSTVYRSGRAGDAAAVDSSGDWDTSSEDHARTADQLCQLLGAHGIECAVSSYSGAHDFPSAANGLAAALPWLAGRLGTPSAAHAPLPGAPSAS
jgi:S-formylglutathione hydrolase FrmB